MALPGILGRLIGRPKGQKPVEATPDVVQKSPPVEVAAKKPRKK